MKNVISNWGGFAFSVLVNFFLSPFVVHHLGDSAYGVWVLMGSLTSYLGLLDLGVRGAVTRYVSKFHATSSHKEASQVASSALAIFTGAGLLAILISVILAVFVVGHFQIPNDYRFAARLVLCVVGCSIAVSLISGVFGGVLTGLQRFDLSNIIEVLSTGLRALLIVFVLNRGKGLIGMAFVHLTFTMLTALAYVVTSLRCYPQLRISFANCDRQHLQMIYSFSKYAFLLSISGYLIYYTDAAVIGFFLPVSSVTFFAIAGNLMMYSRGLLSGISTATSPLASSLESRGEPEDLKRLLLSRARFASVLIFPIAMTFLFRGGTFLSLWMGYRFGGPSGHVLWILTLALFFAAGNQIAGATMMGISRHKGIVPALMSEALGNLGLSVLLVQIMGINGVAWGTTIPSLAVSLLFWPRYIQKILGIPSRTYVRSTWIQPAIAVAPFALASWAINKFYVPSNLFVFFFQVGAILPLSLLGSWFVCFTPRERLAYSQKLFRPVV